MSKASTPIKVLRTGLKRVTKGWVQGAWKHYDPGTNVTSVCLEGALFGYCDANTYGLTEPQRIARNVVLEVIRERHPELGRHATIPEFNDKEGRVLEEVQEVLKLAIIRLETGGVPDGLEDEDIDNLLEFMDSKKTGD